jgi:sn-glycerol 3-phosphate transport system permease protein
MPMLLTRRKWKNLGFHVLVLLAIFVVSMPVILSIVISTQTPSEVYSSPPKLLPSRNFSNYVAAWKSVNLGRMMFNSAFIAATVTFGKIVMSLLAAFAFTHFDFPGKNLLFFIVLVTLLLPIPVRIVALFEITSKLGWIDTYWGLIVPFLASATGTFLFIQRFKMVPLELLDAAKMDGCSPLRYLVQILIPLSGNTIGALVVIEFIYIWNQYLWPLMATNSKEMRVVQIGVKMLTSTETMNNWGIIMAGVVMTMIPPLLVFFFMQQSFMKGFALASEK